MTEASKGFDADRRWWVLGLVVAAQFMVILDVAIVNVALPSIKADLGFSQASLQWVITAYSILFGGVLLLGGRLADILGRRRLFVAGVLVFAASSLLAGLAWSAGALITFRALQGLGGALLTPAALSILMTTFAEGRERNVALGIWGAASGSGGAAGVLLGGVLTSYLNWSWIFFINVPVAAAVIALTQWLLRESRAELAGRHLDVAGAASVTGALMLLVYTMTRATQDGWGTGRTVGLLATSFVMIAAFVVIELRSRAPLLPMRMFRSRTLAAANATCAAIAAIGFSMFFVVTLYLQEVLHYTAVETGAGFLATTLSVIASSNVAQRLVTHFGARPVLTSGLLILAAALVLFARLPVGGRYFSDAFAPLVLGGVGMAFAFVAVTIAGLSGVSRADAGVASGLINTSRQVGGAVGLAAVSTIAATFASQYTRSHPRTPDLAAHALTHGFQMTFYALTGLALVAMLISMGLVGERRPQLAEVTAAADVELEPLQEAA